LLQKQKEKKSFGSTNQGLHRKKKHVPCKFADNLRCTRGCSNACMFAFTLLFFTGGTAILKNLFLVLAKEFQSFEKYFWSALDNEND